MAVEVRTSLAEARLARGLTLEDAERSTRIARKFLIALEEHNYSVFPAPVYARGFLRTYCRYLNLDPEPQLAELPAGWNGTTPTTHLPPVSRPVNLNMTWIVGGVIAACLAAAAFFYMQSDSGLGDLETLRNQQGQEQQQGLSVESAGSGDTDTNSSGATDESPRTLDTVVAGELPNFEGVSADDAIAYLEQQQLDYLVIDTPSNSVAAGLVMGQTPAAGEATSGVQVVILTASSGTEAQGAARTDCSVLAVSNRRTNVEQTYYEDVCSAPQPTGDRTNCEEIRGTDYRSPAEREFFLANCIVG